MYGILDSSPTASISSNRFTSQNINGDISFLMYFNPKTRNLIEQNKDDKIAEFGKNAVPIPTENSNTNVRRRQRFRNRLFNLYHRRYRRDI